VVQLKVGLIYENSCPFFAFFLIVQDAIGIKL